MVNNSVHNKPISVDVTISYLYKNELINIAFKMSKLKDGLMLLKRAIWHNSIEISKPCANKVKSNPIMQLLLLALFEHIKLTE